jgi:dephospho-CoA kinase
MQTIGLTGNFGMGKSTVLKLFNKLGASTFDVDDFVHDILEDPEIIKKITKVLGKNVLTISLMNISINKKRAADIIFNDPHKRKAIEKIIHPEVLKKIKLIESKMLYKKPPALIIFEIPLLFEASYEKHFDKTIVVYCNRNAAITRLAKKGLSKDAALKRIRAQMPITAKKNLADFLIDNNNSVRKTGTQVRQIFKTLANI